MVNEKHYSLTPIVSRWMNDLCEKKDLVYQAIARYDSPINIHCKDNFTENIDAYSAVFQSYGLRSKIYFARKANKSLLFPLSSWKANQGVDTASYREITQCLDANIPPQALVCTAAVKNRQLLEMLVNNGIEIVLDNEDEIALLHQICEEIGRKASVIVRLCGFRKDNGILPSRFGFFMEDAFDLISSRIGNPNELPHFEYKGLHFHLNGYSVEERALALHQSSRLIKRLAELEIRSESLDMGGGILMNYLSDEREWKDFRQALRCALIGEISPITYNNDGLGIILHEGEPIGEMNVYPYFNKINKGTLLHKILETEFDGQPLHQLLASLDVEIRMEPGRSLLDQCGITVAKVAFRKRDTSGNFLVGLEMNRTQLRSSSADFLLDPIHIQQSESEESADEQIDGYLVGAYCLEQELILKRKLRFKTTPKIGDLFVFVNTAGYMMHFYESEAHLFPLAENLVYDSEKEQIREDICV